MSSSDDPKFETQTPPGSEPSAALVPEPDLPLATVHPLAPAPPQPARDPVWSGWDVLQIAGLAVVSIIVLQLLFVVGAKFLIYPHLIWKEAAPKLAQKAGLAILSQFVAYVLVAIYMVALVQGKYRVRFWTAIRWNWPRSQGMLYGMLILGGLVLIVLTLFGNLLPMPKSTPFEDFFKRPSDAYMMAIFAVTLGPLMEELFFRGFLYPLLERRVGVAWGIFFTALPFGLLHMFQYGYAWGVVLLIFLMGVVCTAVRSATGSVASSFLVHVGYNATEMIIFAIATDGFRHMEKAAYLLR